MPASHGSRPGNSAEVLGRWAKFASAWIQARQRHIGGADDLIGEGVCTHAAA